MLPQSPKFEYGFRLKQAARSSRCAEDRSQCNDQHFDGCCGACCSQTPQNNTLLPPHPESQPATYGQIRLASFVSTSRKWQHLGLMKRVTSDAESQAQRFEGLLEFCGFGNIAQTDTTRSETHTHTHSYLVPCIKV